MTEINAKKFLTPEYRAFAAFSMRCENLTNPAYQDYGGRGIKVCDRWRGNFQAFLGDMGPKPSPKHSIDRIDNNGDYSPENCRWATRIVQNNNRRCTVMVLYRGHEMPLADAIREAGSVVSFNAAYARVKTRRLSVEAAVETPPKFQRKNGRGRRPADDSFRNLLGQKFGLLTVIRRAEKKQRMLRWECNCECGSIKIVFGHHLRSGKTKSCGCLTGKSPLHTKGFRKDGNRWRAQMRIKGRLINLGAYATPQEAHDAYLRAKELRRSA